MALLVVGEVGMLLLLSREALKDWEAVYIY